MDIALLPSLLALSPPPFIHIHDPFDQFCYHADSLKAKHCVEIDCIECITPRVLYTRIINGLASWSVSWDNGCECWGGKRNGNWDTSWDAFIQALTVLVRQLQTIEADARFILLLRNSDRMRDLLPNAIIPLTRLSELVKLLVYLISTTLTSRPTVKLARYDHLLFHMSLGRHPTRMGRVSRSSFGHDTTLDSSTNNILSYISLPISTISTNTQQLYPLFETSV
jgi:hypothetical protein